MGMEMSSSGWNCCGDIRLRSKLFIALPISAAHLERSLEVDRHNDRRSTPMERIPAPERTREKSKALMDGRAETTDERSELVRLAARLIIEEALDSCGNLADPARFGLTTSAFGGQRSLYS